MSDEKKCPFCGETIKYVAIKCKHCKANLNVTNETQFETSLDSIQKTSGDKIQVKRLPMWQIFLSVIIFIILGYILFSQFQNVLTTCDNKDVISTLKKLYTDDFGHRNITLNGISTNEKSGNARVCSAIITSSKCKSSSIEYTVRISDNKKEFTVHSVDTCGLISNFQSEIDKLVNSFGNSSSNLSQGHSASDKGLNVKSRLNLGDTAYTCMKGYCKGTVNTIEGIDGTNASLTVLETTKDKESNCASIHESGKEYRSCLTGQRRSLVASANCNLKEISIDKHKVRFQGKFQKKNNFDPDFAFLDVKTNTLLDGSNASSYELYLDYFSALCPSSLSK